MIGREKTNASLVQRVKSGKPPPPVNKKKPAPPPATTGRDAKSPSIDSETGDYRFISNLDRVIAPHFSSQARRNDRAPLAHDEAATAAASRPIQAIVVSRVHAVKW